MYYSPFNWLFGEYTIIRLNGKKKEDNVHINREFGQFTLDILLKSEEYILSNIATWIDKT